MMTAEITRKGGRTMKKERRAAAAVCDMTMGAPLPLVLTFAVPLLISDVFQQVYSMVDTMVVGHVLGDAAISAIGATSALYALLISLASSMNTGFSIVITQAFGARDIETVKRGVAGAMLLNLAVAAVLTLAAVWLLRPLLRWMNTPQEIFRETYRYIVILCLGLAATVGYNLFAGLLRAVGNSRTPLYCLLLSSLVNVVLDILLVVPMGVAGAAVATVAAQAVAGVLCAAAFLRQQRALLPDRGAFCACKSLLGRLLSAGSAMALMLCVVNLGSVIFQSANNGLGQAYITAHTAARKLILIFMQPMGTLATAVSTFVAQNWGAKQYRRIRDTLHRVLLLEVAWGAIAFVLVWLTGDWLVRVTTGSHDAATVQNAVFSLRVHVSMFIPLGLLLCLRTALQAMGHKRAPVLSSCVELAAKGASAAWLIPTVGFVGTSVTEPVTWVLMLAFLGSSYLRQRTRIYPDL